MAQTSTTLVFADSHCRQLFNSLVPNCRPSTLPQRTIGILCTSVSVSPYQVSSFPASGILQITIKPLTIQVRPHNSAIHLLFRRPIVGYYYSTPKFQRPVYCCLFYSCLFWLSVSQRWAIQFRVSINSFMRIRYR